MHIGQFLKNQAEKLRMSTTEIGKAVNKTPQGVRKDFAKEDLHMSVVEAFAKAMNINIYEVLAQEWSNQGYKNPQPNEEISGHFAEEERPTYSSPKNIEAISVTIQLPASKAEALLKLLTD